MNPLKALRDEVEHLTTRLRLHQDYQTVFSTPEGRNVLHDLLRECGTFKTSYDANPHGTAYNEGKRYAALFVQSRLRQDNVPAIMKLLEEKTNDNRRPDETRNYTNDAPPILP